MMNLLCAMTDVFLNVRKSFQIEHTQLHAEQIFHRTSIALMALRRHSKFWALSMFYSSLAASPSLPGRSCGEGLAARLVL